MLRDIGMSSNSREYARYYAFCLRRKRRELGLCIRCGNPKSEDSRSLCKRHRLEIRKQARKHKESVARLTDSECYDTTSGKHLKLKRWEKRTQDQS